MFCMAGQFFCPSGAHFHGKHGCSWNVIAQAATLQDFKSWRFLLFKRRWEKLGVERARVSCCLEKKTRKAHVFLDFTFPGQVNTYTFPGQVNTYGFSHRDIKSDCKRVCVKDVFPHLRAWWSKISTFGMCFHKHRGTHMCILMKIPKWQGNAIKFPAPITIVLGNAYVLKTCFFLCFLKTEIRSCFFRSSSPEPLFLPETPHISRSKAKEMTCSGKTELPKITWQMPKKKYKF
jgi:hypothetical protein